MYYGENVESFGFGMSVNVYILLLRVLHFGLFL